MATSTPDSFLDTLRQHRLLDLKQLEELKSLHFPDLKSVAKELIQRGWLTPYQANQLLNGKGHELFLGPYILLERLGEGGMGQVFKARHRNLHRISAIKLIRKERLDNPSAVRRFQREVRSAAALSHPNIVLAYDADEIAGTHLMVMEYIEGATDLAKLVKKNGPLSVESACEYIRQAALGLQHAYERGMVHRDIKPANLLLTNDGKVVKVLDMGLARLDQPGADAEETSTMTQEGAVMGTPDYIAPEQALDTHTVDIRADLYSLGCTFYFLLTGRVPFPGGTMLQKLCRHQDDEPPAIENLRPEVPPAVINVVRKLMAKRPQDRYHTPAELAAVLTALVQSLTGITTSPVANELTINMPSSAAGTPPSGDSLRSAFAYIEKRTDTVAYDPHGVIAKPRSRRWLVVSIGTALSALVGLVILLLLMRGGMDEGSGDKLIDSSGNKHHGKIVGAKWVKAEGTPIAKAAAPAVHSDPPRVQRIRAAKMPKITGPVLFDTPEADAVVSALEVFPPDNPWNLDVSGWPLHPNSKNIIASIGVAKPLRCNPDMGYVLVPPDQKRVDVKLVLYPGESDRGPFPVPDNTPIEVRYTRGKKKVALDDIQRDKLKEGGDRRALVVDPVGGKLYEFYQLKKTDTGWQAAQSSLFDLKTNKLRPEGWTSVDSAGLPIFPAVVRHDELKRGIVEHALRVTVVKTRRAYVYPARHSASRLTSESLPRMGERIRLRKNFDVAGFTPEVQAILKGLQKYGMFVADNGIDWAISVAPDPRIPVLHDELRKIKGADFEVVQAPPGYKLPE